MSSTAMYGAASADVRVGDILSRSFSLWPKVVGPYSVFFAMAALPSAIQQYALSGMRVMPTQGGQVLQWALITIAVSLLFGTFARAGAAAMSLDILGGGGARFNDSIGQAMRSFFPLLLAQLCAGVGIVLSFLLFIVPALMLISRWLVVTPCCVAERLGPLASLKRSAQLTKGHRWKMFGLLLVLFIAGIISTATYTFVGRIANPAVGAIALLVCSVVTGVFTEVVAACTYTALAAGGGFGGRRLAEVF